MPDDPATPDDPVVGPTSGTPALTVQLDWRPVVAFLAVVTVVLVGWRLVAAAPEATRVVIVAGFLALALDPVVVAVGRRLHLGRGAATALVLGTGIAVAVGFVVLVGPDVVDQSANVGRDLPATIDSIGDLPLVGDRLRDAGAIDRLQTALRSLPDEVAGSESDVADVVAEVAVGLVWLVVGALLVAAALADGPGLVRRVRGVVPEANRDLADETGRVVYDVLARYFSGNLLLATLHGSWVTVTGTLAGVPLSPVLGVWTAITSLIPQVGGLLGFALVVLVSLTQGLGVTAFMAIAFFAYMTFNNNVLLPVVVGRAVKVSAPVTMLAAVAGFSVAGVIGSLLAVPTVGAVKAVASYLRHRDDPCVERPTAPTGELHLRRKLVRLLDRARSRLRSHPPSTGRPTGS